MHKDKQKFPLFKFYERKSFPKHTSFKCSHICEQRFLLPPSVHSDTNLILFMNKGASLVIKTVNQTDKNILKRSALYHAMSPTGLEVDYGHEIHFLLAE